MTFVLPAIRSRKPVAATAGIRKRRAHPEETLQMQVVKFLSLALDGSSEFFAVPNGGRRGFREAQRFKAQGVKAGVPDLIVISDGRAIGIELKAGKTPLSDAQKYYHERLRLARVPVSVCRSVEEVEAALRRAGVPLRATLEAPVIRAMRAAGPAVLGSGRMSAHHHDRAISQIAGLGRRRLRDRRPSLTETIAFAKGDGNIMRYEATISFDELLRPREIFLSGAKDGSEMAAALVDTAVALSVALQHGVSATVMGRSTSRLPAAPDEEPTMPASIVGAALDLLARHEADAQRIQQLAADDIGSREP